MEGNLSSDTPPVASVDHHLTRSNSDASSLTAANYKDSFLPSKNVTPQDECTTWTNEKHYSYLYHLEMSFVEQLYQSKSMLDRCSGHNMRDINISRKQSVNLNNASNQYNLSNNGRQKIKGAAGEPIPCSSSADSHASLESKRTHSKHRGVDCHPSPAKMRTSRKPIGAWKQGKEGTGQNFSDELDCDSQAKKLKIALRDGSLDDQIVPSSRLFNHQ